MTRFPALTRRPAGAPTAAAATTVTTAAAPCPRPPRPLATGAPVG